MKPRDLLAGFGAFWMILIILGALDIVEFRVYAGSAAGFKTFCEKKQ